MAVVCLSLVPFAPWQIARWRGPARCGTFTLNLPWTRVKLTTINRLNICIRLVLSTPSVTTVMSPRKILMAALAVVRGSIC